MKMENRNLNIPNVTIDEVIELLMFVYSDPGGGQISYSGIPTPFLWGPAGVGKSEGIRQFAERLGKETGKRVIVTDVRLLLFSPVDLRGMPVADKDKEECKWLIPDMFRMDPSDDCINILFLDELSAAPQSVQAAAYQICLDRKIGEHRFPENCIVIAAGNRTTDQSVSYKMPKALCNRLMHFNVETNYSSWLRWAMANDIDSRVIGYLAFDNSKLCTEPGSSDMAYPTPRSWSFVSGYLKRAGDDIEKVHNLISGCVGTDIALELEAWIKANSELPDASEVYGGRCTKYPKSYDALLAFTAGIVSDIRARRDSISADELENACAYVKKFPTDFAMTFYSDLNAIEEIRLKLMKCPSCREWLAKNKNIL